MIKNNPRKNAKRRPAHSVSAIGITADMELTALLRGRKKSFPNWLTKPDGNLFSFNVATVTSGVLSRLKG